MFDQLPLLVSPSQVRSKVRSWRAFGEKVALVPTHGPVHEGHTELIRSAQQMAERVLAVVDPQVDEDRREADLELLDAERVDAIYTPTAQALLPPGFATRISVPGVTDVMEGADDATPFERRALITLKLLLQAQPDHVMFCESDWQLKVALDRISIDLDVPVARETATIARDMDGIVMAAGLERLDGASRAAARALNPALRDAAAAILEGAPVPTALATARDRLIGAGARVRFLDARGEETLAPAPT
ncbi:MAG: pantoate--beta-alanine ligase, partial [Pseudomonadota bacterium]